MGHDTYLVFTTYVVVSRVCTHMSFWGFTYDDGSYDMNGCSYDMNGLSEIISKVLQEEYHISPL